MEEQTGTDETIGAAGVALTVEMGDDFEPGPRTAAALAELVDALHDEHGPETAGYMFQAPAVIRNVSFVLGDGSVKPGLPGNWKVGSFDGKGNDL